MCNPQHFGTHSTKKKEKKNRCGEVSHARCIYKNDSCGKNLPIILMIGEVRRVNME